MVCRPGEEEGEEGGEYPLLLIPPALKQNLIRYGRAMLLLRQGYVSIHNG